MNLSDTGVFKIEPLEIQSQIVSRPLNVKALQPIGWIPAELGQTL